MNKQQLRIEAWQLFDKLGPILRNEHDDEDVVDQIDSYFNYIVQEERKDLLKIFEDTVKSQGLNWSDFRMKMLEESL